MGDRFYVCDQEVFSRLKAETRCLFERYPEDDGVMVFDPPERMKRLERVIRIANDAVLISDGVDLMYYMELGYGGPVDPVAKATLASVLRGQPTDHTD